jgi:hypothetical protein
VSRRLPNEAVGFEEDRLDGAEERPGERSEDAGRFEVRAVAPTNLQKTGGSLNRAGFRLPPDGGLARVRNTVISMSIKPECPDRDFFVRYFWTVATPPQERGH